MTNDKSVKNGYLFCYSTTEFDEFCTTERFPKVDRTTRSEKPPSSTPSHISDGYHLIMTEGEFTFNHVLNVVMCKEDDSCLGKSLSHSGINSVRSLLELKNDAINNLYFINEAGDKVKTFSWEQGCIRILQSYTNHRSDTCNPIYDWMSITP